MNVLAEVRIKRREQSERFIHTFARQARKERAQFLGAVITSVDFRRDTLRFTHQKMRLRPLCDVFSARRTLLVFVKLHCFHSDLYSIAFSRFHYKMKTTFCQIPVAHGKR